MSEESPVQKVFMVNNILCCIYCFLAIVLQIVIYFKAHVSRNQGFILKLWLLMVAFAVIAVVNTIMSLSGCLTPFSLVLMFDVSTMILELLHWIFCW